MIDPSNDEDLDALLGGGRLPGPARDRIFDEVAAQITREPRPRGPRNLWKIAVVAVAAAAGLILVIRAPTRTAPRVRAKGDQMPATLQLDVACIGGTLDACPLGATLMFGASGAAGNGLLSAYAEPMTPGSERVWYFSADGESPRLDVGSGTSIATRAARIGPEHVPGNYRVHVFLTPAPASRALLLSGGPRDSIASREVDLHVIAPAGAGGRH